MLKEPVGGVNNTAVPAAFTVAVPIVGVVTETMVIVSFVSSGPALSFRKTAKGFATLIPKTTNRAASPVSLTAIGASLTPVTLTVMVPTAVNSVGVALSEMV